MLYFYAYDFRSMIWLQSAQGKPPAERLGNVSLILIL